jgi:hypothetical protein
MLAADPLDAALADSVAAAAPEALAWVRSTAGDLAQTGPSADAGQATAATAANETTAWNEANEPNETVALPGPDASRARAADEVLAQPTVDEGQANTVVSEQTGPTSADAGQATVVDDGQSRPIVDAGQPNQPGGQPAGAAEAGLAGITSTNTFDGDVAFDQAATSVQTAMAKAPEGLQDAALSAADLDPDLRFAADPGGLVAQQRGPPNTPAGRPTSLGGPPTTPAAGSTTPAAQRSQRGLAGPEANGVQASSIGSDRTSIRVLVLPPLNQILPAIAAMIPSTGGPSAAALALGLIALGGLGVRLRRIGLRRSPGSVSRTANVS